ncbi:WD repeat-containing protein 93, partial [Tinamus guttatus]
RKHPLEIPPPSEKDWIKDDEEDFFLQDPDRAFDALPQPVRMVKKLVMLVFENAMEIIERREALQEAQKRKVQATKCFPTAEFQVTGRASCLAASGKYVFVGLSMGLAVFQVSDCKQVCAWDTAKTEICVIRASALGNEHHALLAVDELGFVWLFCFHKDSFLFIKNLNEVEDISKRSTCVEVVLSQGGDYAGLLLQGNTEAWLEIYRLPKDSWLKERENSPGSAVGLAFRDRKSSQGSTADSLLQESLLSASKTDIRTGLPVLLMKVKPPKPITGQGLFPDAHPAASFRRNSKGIVAPTSIKQDRKTFLSSQPFSTKGPTFHPLIFKSLHYLPTPGRIILSVPAGISVHWDGSHNLCLYLLSRSFKEKVDVDPKPEVVWPCAAPIACSAVSSCCRYLALACEDAAITIWDQHLGYPLTVTALLDEHVIRSMHFL